MRAADLCFDGRPGALAAEYGSQRADIGLIRIGRHPAFPMAVRVTLAEAAGMTHGSLYSQFDSKEHLATEALSRAFDASAAKYDEVQTLSAYAERYLSPRHRDTPGSGCAIAALGCEVPRQGNAMRQTFTEGLRRLMERLTRLLGPKARRKCENEALAIAATLVGGMILARAVDDRQLSDRILAACRERLIRT